MIFAAAVFLAAFLLFAVQPLAGRVLTPHFGGTPAVWTTCLMFFQVALFAGYLWVHGGARKLGPRALAGVHIITLIGALAFLPVAVAPGDPTGSLAQPASAVLSWLVACVLAPYFVLATTAPLLQSWYAGLHGREPYHLYAISNVGSLLGVAAYPLLVEPWVPVSSQRIAFTAGFTIFVALSALIAVRWARSSPQIAPAPSPSPSPSPVSAPVPGARAVASWLGLSSFPVLLLIAVTNHLTVDVAAGPFLWMPPLFVYLLSFVLVFWRPAAVPAAFMTWMWTAMTVALGANLLLSGKATLASQLLVSLGVLFSGSMLCNTELVRRRPGTAYLTTFFVCVAGGGALGGLAGGWMAPRVFRGYYELHVAVLGIFALLLGLRPRGGAGRRPNATSPAIKVRLERLGLFLGIGSALPVMAASLYLQTRTDLRGAHVQERRRNFFGTVQVTRQDGATLLTHGRIQHGMQWNDAGRRRELTMYFGRDSAVGRVLSEPGPPRRIGVLGLGVGTLAAYGRPGDAITFFEIDPDVAEMARKWFSYLSDSKARVEVVIGDGRAALAATDARFDVLVLDAFSSDAVPIHLLTVEAFAMYEKHLMPGGRIVANVSNRHLAVERVVAGAATDRGWAFRVYETAGDPTRGLAKVRWVVMVPGATAARKENDDPHGFPGGITPSPLAGAAVLWTDDKSSLLPLL